MNIRKISILMAAGIGIAVQAFSQYSWTRLPEIASPVFKKDTFNITRYGAVPDGITLNTTAINNAITACSRNGGGVVLVPEGLWLTGPVVMKNNVNLHLKSAATLLFTPDKSQYALVEGLYEGRSAARNQSPVSGSNLHDIAITGKGVIDGNGDVWRAVGKGQLTESEWKKKVASGGVFGKNGNEWYPSEQYKAAKEQGMSMLLVPGKPLEEYAVMKDFLRPNLVALNNCKRVLLEGVIFQNSAAWCLHPSLCEDLTLRNLLVKNPAYAQNGDGADIESCRNFLIEGCTFDVGDDAICIKSGKDEEGRRRGKPTENGIVRNSIVYKAHGGFVIGSEMSGGARNIFVYNCTFVGTDKGLRFKSTRGRGGVVEKIYAKNIFMKDIVEEAVFFDLYYFVKFTTDSQRDERPQVNEGTPVFRDMEFDNIVCNGAKKAIFIRGLPEMPVRNIRISNSVFKTTIGKELTDADNIVLDNVRMDTQVPRDTSFAVWSTYQKQRLKFPFIKIASPTPPAGMKQAMDVPYREASGRSLLLDVFYSKEKQRKPAVLLIFGGGWHSGDKTHNHAMAVELVKRGYVAVSAEYRLSGEAQYPAAVQDLKAAVRWMRAHAGEYGIDTNHIAALGCSAGGQLAALMGATNGAPKFEEGNIAHSSAVQAAIDIDGILAFKHPESAEAGAASEWLGGTYEEKPELWKEASALTYAGSNTVPMLFINSSFPQFHAGRNDMMRVLKEHKIYSEAHELPDTPHPFWFFDPWFDKTMDYSTAFLQKVFR
ncbi:polygalacturonase/acetyl esterase/lipase [Chitinophaga sp. W3I9]|uniref:glycosyl hydrolase family 28 protein n=1 Tax=Chitinophaga sp. W3I9 TaxID=3373924 RepID=UPI003D1FFF07